MVLISVLPRLLPPSIRENLENLEPRGAEVRRVIVDWKARKERQAAEVRSDVYSEPLSGLPPPSWLLPAGQKGAKGLTGDPGQGLPGPDGPQGLRGETPRLHTCKTPVKQEPGASWMRLVL